MAKLNPSLDIYDPNINALWEIGQAGGRTRPINKEVLFNNLLIVKEVFEELDIKFWLSHGTMLGVYRDGDFISYDDDADISCSMKDREKGMIAEEILRTRGFYVPTTGNPSLPINPKSNMPYSDSVAIKDGEKIEVWWFTEKDSKYIYDPLRPPPELVHDAKFYDSLGSISFRGKTFPIPNHTEEWVVMMYGTSWNIPKQGVKYNNALGRKQ